MNKLCVSFAAVCACTMSLAFAQPAPFPATAPAVTRLSDLSPDSARQDWGGLGIDRSVQNKPLTIGKRVFTHGLGTHANSEVVFDLERLYETFECWVGVDAEMDYFGKSSVVFKVVVDGKELFDSGVMKNSAPARQVKVSVKGASQLKLIVTNAGDDINGDHGDWGEPILTGGPVETAVVEPAAYEVKAAGMVVKLSANGNIVSLVRGGGESRVAGRTNLAMCEGGAATAKALDGGGVEFRRPWTHRQGGGACVMTQRFLPAPSSLRWEVEIAGPAGGGGAAASGAAPSSPVSSAKPWSTAIRTALQYPATADSRHWLAWSDPQGLREGWRDPLVLQPLADVRRTYANTTNALPVDGDFITMPLVTFAEPAGDTGLSLVLSPEDLLLEVALALRRTGLATWTRRNYRIGGSQPVKFAMDLVPHEADWRGGLRWMAQRYAQYFDPPNPAVDEMAGCGAYSADEKPIDVEKFKKMSFRINWKCSEDFAYMGMFLPPMASDTAQWRRGSDEPAIKGKSDFNSYKSLNDYSRTMRTSGLYVLNYFNVTEFGRNVKFPPPPRQAKTDADLWKDPNDMLFGPLKGGVLMDRGRPHFTCYNALATDCGDPAYQAFMLEQAKRHIEKLPDSSGICIDRLDWLQFYNRSADDGVSWIDGGPARSLYVSWRDLMDKLGPMMHQAGKVIFINNHRKRLELGRHVDGIFCEFAHEGCALNATALLCIRKPALAWTANEGVFKSDPDGFFQRHLHLGAYPTAPYPGNNHVLGPSAFADKCYLEYGLLMDQMRGKKWVLSPHCVSAEGGAKVNLFAVPGGFALPVTFAGKAQRVKVTVREPAIFASAGRLVYEAYHPGVAKPVAVTCTVTTEKTVILDVPIVRGCAMVKVRMAD